MESDPRIIKKHLKAISQLQEKHLDSFETMLMPDLEQQRVEREKAFDQLRAAFQIFTNTINRQGSEASYEAQMMAERFLDDINGLMDQNQRLKTKVMQLKTELKKSMNTITAGRKAINAYGSSISESNRPRAINLSN